MNDAQLLGAMRALLWGNDEGARRGLADAFEESGDHETAALLREGGFATWASWRRGVDIADGGIDKRYAFHCREAFEAFIEGWAARDEAKCELVVEEYEHAAD